MAEFWVAIAFVVFLLILLYYKVPKLIAKSLDDRAEADAILEQARHEAEAFAHETRASLKDTLERRTQQAEDKIGRAEAQAVDEVRAAAIELAMAAAERILREKTAGAGGAALIDQGIRDLKGRLN
jgi:F-type H+-transporting ATPase subunit b